MWQGGSGAVRAGVGTGGGLVCQAWLPLGDADVAEDPGVQSETTPPGAQPQTPPAFPPTKHYPREVWGLAK